MRVLSRVLSSKCECVSFKLARTFSINSKLFQNAQQLSIPPSENAPEPVSPKIENLVNEISKLTLIEVSELSSVLKKRLNIPDTPVMAFGGFAGVPAAAVTSTEEEEDAAPQKVAKSSFNVKLVKFDETKKVALIKEIKGLLTDMNLVQAKKFVESAPVVIKSDLAKDEAEKLKETLEKIGGEIVIE